MSFFVEAFLKYFEPIPNIDIDEWADRYRILPRGTTEPGKWRTSRTPYLRKIMKDLSPSSPVQKVVVMKGTQLGFTEVGNNMIGYFIHIDPRPIGMWLPTEKLAEKHAKKKLWKMVEETPVLKERVSPRSKGSGENSTITQWAFPGGSLSINGSNSSASYRSDSISVAIKDDIDGFVDDVEGEGSPIELIDNRTDAYPNRKIYENSTPTIDGISHIQKEFEDSTQSEYYMPCPHCKELVKFDFERFKFDYDQKTFRLKGDIFFSCKHCGSLIEESYKTWMMAEENGARWIAKQEHEVSGYKINSFYSPLGWTSWKRIIQEFLKAKKNLEDGDDRLMKRFYNTRLAEPYKPLVKKTTSIELEKLKVDIEPLICPKETWEIVMSVDLQKDHFWYEVRALLYGNSYHVLAYGRAEDWADIESIMRRSYESEDGKQKFGVRLCAIDSGYRTDEVYEFCLMNEDICIPIKGNTTITTRYRSTRIEKETYNIELYIINPNSFKDILDLKIKRSLKLIEEKQLSDKNIITLHKETDKIFFEQYTSEYKIAVKGKYGIKRFEWVKYKEDNHLWDCGTYNTFLAELLGHRFAKKELKKISEKRKHKKRNAPSYLDNF